MKKLDPNMTLKKIHDYCSTHLCRDCEFVNTDWTCPFCKEPDDTIPAIWKFGNSKQVLEAKRPAQKGEYITPNSSSCWTVGTTRKLAFLVSKRDNALERVECMAGDIKICMDDSEYNVIENYVPDQKGTAPSDGDTECGNSENVYEKTIAPLS